MWDVMGAFFAFRGYRPLEGGTKNFFKNLFNNFLEKFPVGYWKAKAAKKLEN